jgi:hypothetical protein
MKTTHFAILAVGMFGLIGVSYGQTGTNQEWTLELSGETSIITLGAGQHHATYKFVIPKSGHFQTKATVYIEIPKSRTEKDGTFVTLSGIPDQRPATLVGEQKGNQVHFWETLEPLTVQVVGTVRPPNRGPVTMGPVAMPIPARKREFEMKLNDGETTVLSENNSGSTGSSRYTLHLKSGRSSPPLKPKMDKVVVKGVPVIKQQKVNDCWLAAIMMMEKTTRASDIFDHVDPKFERIYNKDNFGLDSKEMTQLAQELHLKSEGAANFPLDALQDFLKAGPVEMTIQNVNGNNLHAVVVTGATGDGSAQGSTITYIDPDAKTGGTFTVSFEEFLKLYEGPGHETASARVFHF